MINKDFESFSGDAFFAYNNALLTVGGSTGGNEAVMLWNPVSSGKLILIDKASVWSDFSKIQVGRLNSATSFSGGLGIIAYKNSSIISGLVGEIKYRNSGSNLTLSHYWELNTAGGTSFPYTFDFRNPYIIPEGYGFCAYVKDTGTTARLITFENIEFREKSIS